MTDSGELTSYVLDKDGVVRFAAARATALTPAHLEVLARDTHPLIRLRVVEDPRTPLRVLRVLTDDKNSIVRRWVATNPNANESILEKLQRDHSAGVRKFVSGMQTGKTPEA